MQAFIDAISARAFKEGHDAYLAGQPRQAPAKFGVYSGNFVQGWEAAQFQNFSQKAA